MSEIRATTISDLAGTGPATLTRQYAAKAWINFDGTGTVTIRGSGNVSSIADNGTGDYTVSFIANFANTNYSAPGLTNGDAGGSVMAPYQSPRSALVGAHTMETRRADTFVAVDSSDINYAYFGDLA